MCLCLLLGLIVFTSLSQQSVTTVSNSPFKEALQSGTFLDHSNLIQELYRYKRIIVTAPKGYGKSVNLDMVKRFAEIIVNEEGQPVPTLLTQNYALFKVYNLSVYKDTQFFERNFGKNPVVHIDYSALDPTSEDTVIASYRKIQNETFWPHRYLFKNKKLWLNEELDVFRKYTEAVTDENDIILGFIFLLRVLHDHFKAKVIVVVDEYDSYLNTPGLKTNPDRKSIINFINEINEDCLTLNPFLERAILMGEVTQLKACCKKITCHTFLEDPFNKYYGINENEINLTVNKILKVEKTKETIQMLKNDIEKVNRHSSDALKKTLYSISDVFSFVKNIN